VTLTFDFGIGLDHPVHGGYGWGGPTPRRKKVIVKQWKFKSFHGLHWRARNQNELADRPSVNIWNWTCVIALQITDPPSRQRGCPTWKRK
jgi:hypothetical protein